MSPERTPGHRELTDFEQNLIRSIRGAGEYLERLVKRAEGCNNNDPTWIAAAKLDLQKGLMGLVRGIINPDHF